LGQLDIYGFKKKSETNENKKHTDKSLNNSSNTEQIKNNSNNNNDNNRNRGNTRYYSKLNGLGKQFAARKKFLLNKFSSGKKMIPSKIQFNSILSFPEKLKNRHSYFGNSDIDKELNNTKQTWERHSYFGESDRKENYMSSSIIGDISKESYFNDKEIHSYVI